MEERAILESLAREVDLIVSSRYPVALQGLRSLLDQVSSAALQAWARDNPCHVHSLAVSILEGLTDREWAFDLLTSLAQSSVFRSAILQHDPAILDHFVHKAISSSDEKYSRIVLLLLEHPLPSHCGVPASTEHFIRHVCQRASNVGDLESIRALCTVIPGPCSGLFTVLPIDERNSLERNLKMRIKVSSSNGEDPIITLYGIRILLFLAKAKIESQRSDTKEIENGKRYLASELSKKVDKTNQMVIVACKTRVGEDAAEIIRLASQVLDVLGSEAMMEWRRGLDKPISGSSAVLLRNLCERVSTPDVSTLVQRELLAYLARFSAIVSLPANVTITANQVVGDCYKGPHGSCQWLAKLLDSFATSIRQDTLKGLLCAMISDAQRGTTASSLENIASISDAIRDALKPSQQLCNVVASIAVHPDLTDVLIPFMTSSACGLQSEVAVAGACPDAVEEKRRIAKLSIEAAISVALACSAPSETDSTPRRSTVAELAQCRVRLSAKSLCCDHTQLVVRSAPRSIVEQACTQSRVRMEDWRGRINEAIELQHDQQKARIVQVVTQVCRDLEIRCADVEAPLRKEQENTKQLEKRCDDIVSENQRLIAEVQQGHASVAEMEIQIHERDEIIKRRGDELRSAQSRIQLAEKDKIEAAEAASRLAEERSAKHNKEMLQMRAEVCRHCEELDLRMNAISELELSLQEAKSDYQQLQIELTDSRNSQADLRQQLAEMEGKCVTLTNNLQHSAAENAETRDLLHCCRTEIHSMRQELEQARCSVGGVQRDLARVSDDARQSVQTAQLKYTEELKEKVETIRELHESIRVKQVEAETIAARGSDAQYRLQQTIDSQLDEIQDLQAKVTDSAAALRQLENWVAAKPPGRANIVEAKPAPRCNKRASHSTPRKDVADTTECEAVSEHDTSVVDSEIGPEQASQGGSTPKRARSHMPFKPVVASTRVQVRRSARRSIKVAGDMLVNGRTGNMGDQGERPALADVSTRRGNQSPLRQRPAAGIKASKDMDHAATKTPRPTLPAFSSFDFEGCVTSTPTTRPGVQGLPDVTEMTMDFSTPSDTSDDVPDESFADADERAFHVG